MLNDFNNIKKSSNESAFDFNVRFQKAMYKLFQVMRLNEDVCLTTYFNAFDSKMAYVLRDKESKTLRDAYTMAINIENNRRATGNLGKRDDPKLFNSRGKRDNEKPVLGKKFEDDQMGQVLSLLKQLNSLAPLASKPNTQERAPYNNNFNRQPRMQNYPYNTQWKDGKPIPNPIEENISKGTPNPLQINLVNMNDDIP